MTKNIHEPSLPRAVSSNRFVTKDTRQRPYAGLWVHPLNETECPPVEGDPNPYGGIEHDWTPCLMNDFLQVAPEAIPANGNLESFAFRQHYDRSLEFKGHLDVASATSNTVAFILPGINTGEPDYIDALDHDQFWHTVITDDGGTSFIIALVYINAINGEVTITWPAS